MRRAPRYLSHAVVAACIATAGGSALAQSAAANRAAIAAPPAAPSVAREAAVPQPSATAGARYLESCQQALERGVATLSCQAAPTANELARLREDALRSNNPNLLMLLGDAYSGNRAGVGSDVGQAYRWYLLAAVRGDPRAMQRLSELYKGGAAAPPDNIKALGYARLAERLSVPGSTSAQQAAESAGQLGRGMAAEEIVQADRFAAELERGMRREGASPPGGAEVITRPAPDVASVPGLEAARRPASAASAPRSP